MTYPPPYAISRAQDHGRLGKVAQLSAPIVMYKGGSLGLSKTIAEAA